MKTRSFLLVAFASASLAVLPASEASARTAPFVFHGAGWGHGVGMSQWGAYGLARRGWGDERILRHYYQGTRVQRWSHRPRLLRIGIAQGVRAAHVHAERAPVQLRVGSRWGPLVGSMATGATWTVTHPGRRYRVVNQRGHVIGGRTWARPMVIRYSKGGGLVRIAETGHTYGRGLIQLGSGCSGCSMHLVAVVGS